MTNIASELAGWTKAIVGGVQVQVVPPAADPAGIVVLLADADWPDAGEAAQLRDLLQGARLGGVLPGIRSSWIDRPEPVLTPARSPLGYVVDELVPWIAGQWSPSTRLAAMGVGFGGQGALQLAYREPRLFPVAAAICPALDFHRLYDSWPLLQEWFETQERARQETATLRLHPLNWPPHQWLACPRGDWRFDGCERLASKLTSIGIPLSADLETPDGPAYREMQSAAALRFVAERLREPVSSREIRFQGPAGRT